MTKQILIDSCFGLVRTAIAIGTNLLDYYEESPDQGRAKGNIYRGVVKRVDGNIQAAFIRYSGGRDGFLPLRDADSVSAVGGNLRVGDPILVQVVKDEVGEKGAALTARLSISGRYLVYMPDRSGDSGISSRINDEERAVLKRVLNGLEIPENGSVILRTAALNKDAAELQADLNRLVGAHREILAGFGQGEEPALLFREAHPALRYLREYYSGDVARIWVNEEDMLEPCRQFFQLYEPESVHKVVLSKDGPLMFQRLGLESEVDKLGLRKVPLPSGANIVIDETEALVAIDVNSAKAGGGRGEDAHRHKGLEETIFAVNKEAALEISRQLRLRDLGGIIVVDFIDMEDSRHCRQLEDIVRRAMASDKAKVKVFEISPLGTLQISRQRLRKAGPNFTKLICDTCNGKGWHTHPAVNAFSVLRKIVERLLRNSSSQDIRVSVPYPVANELLNEFREQVLGLERRFSCSIYISALPTQIGEAVFGTGGVSQENVERVREALPKPIPRAKEHPAKIAEGKPGDREGGRRRRNRRGGRHAGNSLLQVTSLPVAAVEVVKPSAHDIPDQAVSVAPRVFSPAPAEVPAQIPAIDPVVRIASSVNPRPVRKRLPPRPALAKKAPAKSNVDKKVIGNRSVAPKQKPAPRIKPKVPAKSVPVTRTKANERKPPARKPNG